MSYGLLGSLMRHKRKGVKPSNYQNPPSLAEFEQMYNDELKKAGLA